MLKLFKCLPLVGILLLSNAIYAGSPFKLFIYNKTNLSFKTRNSQIAVPRIPASQITSTELNSRSFIGIYVEGEKEKKNRVYLDIYIALDPTKSHCKFFKPIPNKYGCTIDVSPTEAKIILSNAFIP